MNALSASLNLCLAVLTALSLSACDMGKKLYGGSEEPETAQKIAEDLLLSDDLVLEISPDSAVLSSGDITEISNLKATPLFPLGTLDLIPDTTQIANLVSGWMRFSPPLTDNRFRTPGGSPMDYGSVSIVAVVKSSSRGKIISFDPDDVDTEAFAIEVSGTQVTGKFNSSISSHFSSSVPLPSSSDMIVAASFGESSEDLVLTTNGVLAGSASITGTGLGPQTVERVLSLGPIQTSETLSLKRLFLFNRALSKKEIGSVVSYLSAKDSISIELDPSLQIDPPASDPLFDKVKTVLAANCLSCHSSWNGVSASYFISQNLVKTKNPEGSPLYYRLRDSSGSFGPKTMPPSAPLSTNDREALKTWINSL